MNIRQSVSYEKFSGFILAVYSYLRGLCYDMQVINTFNKVDEHWKC